MRKVFDMWTAVLLLFLLVSGCGGGGSSTPPPVPSITDINGGTSGSGSVNSLFIIDGAGLGSLTAATANYSVDFRDMATNKIVASASVNYFAGDWNDIYIKGTVPSGLTASTTYKVTVTTAGGTSNAVNFLVVASVAFSPSTIQWSQTSALPVGQQGFPTVVAPIFKSMTSVTNNYIYAVGGNTVPSGTVGGKASNVDTVYYNQLDNATGTLKNASWGTTTPLPASRGFSAAVLANRFNSFVSGYGTMYVLGGLDNAGNATDTVYYTSLNLDGTTGTWATATKLPKALFAEGAVIFHGRIYVAGGNDSTGTPVKSAFWATINKDGTIGAWQALPDMPLALAYHQLVSAAGYLYAIGGDTAIVDPITNVPSSSSRGDVYYGQINFLDGSLVNASWTTNSQSMSKSREKYTAVVAGSNILVSGGLYGGNAGSSEQSYTSINPGGSLGSFNGATGVHTISGSTGGYNFYNQSTAYFVDDSGNPHVLILGGGDVNTGALHGEVWYQH